MTIASSNMDSEEDHKPRYMVFSKVEKLIQEMQHAETGIPVRCQKIFLTTIPCAFTGYDLVEWIMDRLNIEDPTEALHFSGLLCQYGYLFPVTDSKTTSVKDDGTLYRFQTPYFWPSQNLEPDNVDYAIYLAKRTMRNKQRHALEEHEQSSFNKLQKMICDKWDFIYMQAEEQVRLAKERKKADKVVLDSQEKAFWRVHRPPPGLVKCLELGTKRNFKPSQTAVLKKNKKTVEGFKKEIEFLSRCVRQARMKTSVASESLIARCEQYEEHDPFLSPAQPSNPWVTDDTTMWQLNTKLVEIPTERRVKRWAFGLKGLLADPSGCHELEMFLEKEYSSENIRFWMAVEELKKLPLSRVEKKAREIYRDFLESGAPYEINIDGKTMDETIQGLKEPDRYTFMGAQEHIFLLMKKDSYARYIRSPQYSHLLSIALNPCPKKKFTFGRKKKSPVPSPKPKRRGSTSSAMANDKMLVTNSLSHHSYSTGNLQELDGPSSKSSPYGSSGDVKAEGSNDRGLSPKCLRKKLDDLVRPDSARSNLEVPPGYSMPPPETPDSATHSVNIKVPNTREPNVVAPWEDQDP